MNAYIPRYILLYFCCSCVLLLDVEKTVNKLRATESIKNKHQYGEFSGMPIVCVSCCKCVRMPIRAYRSSIVVCIPQKEEQTSLEIQH